MTSVLIIGAGPTGLTAAVELVRRGIRPRIIDKAAGHPEESRALAIHVRTMQILEASGVTDELIKQANRIFAVHATDDIGRTLFRLDVSAESPPFNFLLSLPQSETERILAAALAQQGIQVEWNTEVTKLTLENDRAMVSFIGPNGAESMEPDYVIGADGAHSLVRKSLSIGFKGERQVDPFGLVDVRFHKPVDATQLHLRFLPRGLVGLIPMSPTFGRFVAPEPKLLEQLPNSDNIAKRVWETEFHISFRHVETFQKGNVFLAGDAAHIHSPVGGRGMNLGIEDAAWLAWLIEQGRPEDYTRDRLPTAKKVLRFTKLQTQLIASERWFARLARGWLIPWALKLQFVRRRAVRAVRALDTREPPWLLSDK